ncbi:hypothetical protein SAMN05216338_1009118 [Bradyrhizobium sp. Rc2d]|nr:hypothetical protein SAMN05216338_1009118 [Bradyrhizobium sp. Rc2d]
MVNATVSRQPRCSQVAGAATGSRIAELAELQFCRNHLVRECVKQSDRFELVAFFAYEGGHDVKLHVDAILEVLYA